MRSYESIEAAKSALRNRQTEAAVSGYPPGYITGVKLTIDEHGQLVVGTGAANVAGRPVNKGVSYTLTAGDWNCSKVFGMPYSLYLDSTGAFHVDSQDAVYTETYFGYYHPSMSTWRNIGRLFVALSTGLIIYCSTGDPDTFGGRTVVVACPGYRGDYDYLMDSDNGQPQIQRAIDYVYQQYGGGRVDVTEGDATITAKINLYSGCELHLRSGCTITKAGAFDAVSAIGTSGTPLTGVSVSGDGIFARSVSDDSSGTYHFVRLDYVNGFMVSGIECDSPDADGIRLRYCTKGSIDGAYCHDSEQGNGITVFSKITGTSVSVRNCRAIDNTYTGIVVINGESSMITANTCSGNGQSGIRLLGLGGTSTNCGVISNRCEGNTEDGINLVSDCANTMVVSNYCYGNGSDTGIGNANSDNFSDAGTDTHIEANSWQQPVTAEPGGATWHKVANPATGWFASKTSGWTADSFSSGLTVDFSAVVPVGTKAVRVFVYIQAGAAAYAYSRKGSDTNISNTPGASSEFSHRIMHFPIGDGGALIGGAQVVVWLSAAYTADFAVGDTSNDLYVAYPLEYLL